jgi:hypothetical protein
MWEQVSQCIKFLTRALDKNNLENENDKLWEWRSWKKTCM